MTSPARDIVAICIPTYRRPESLRTLLDALRAQSADLPDDVRIIVIDNDPEQSARAVVNESVAASDDDPATAPRYVTESRPGVVYARNTALDVAMSPACNATWIAFIDDDEVPSDDWLRYLLDTARRHDADAATGPVDRSFDVEPESWIRDGGFFTSPSHPTGSRRPVAFTGNLLLRADTLSRLNLRFDPALALSGGEDVMFSRRLAKAGGRIVWCEDARATEPQPAERLTRDWILARAHRIGTTTAYVEFATRPRIVACLIVATLGLYKILKAAAFLPMLAWTGRARRVHYQRLFVYGLGMLRGLRGHLHPEYARFESRDASEQ